MNTVSETWKYSSNRVRTNKGAFKYSCDICGGWSLIEYGYNVEYTGYGENGARRKGLCAKCSKKIIPKLGEFFDSIDKMRNSP